MKIKQLQLIHNVLDDYADMVFNDQDDYSEETLVNLVEALRTVKIELERIKEDKHWKDSIILPRGRQDKR